MIKKKILVYPRRNRFIVKRVKKWHNVCISICAEKCLFWYGFIYYSLFLGASVSVSIQMQSGKRCVHCIQLINFVRSTKGG